MSVEENVGWTWEDTASVAAPHFGQALDLARARSARFEREAEVAEAGKSLTIADLERDTAQAWLDRHYQEAIRDLLVKQRDEARLQIEGAGGPTARVVGCGPMCSLHGSQ